MAAAISSGSFRLAVRMHWDATFHSTIRLPNTEFTFQAKEYFNSPCSALTSNTQPTHVKTSQRKFTTQRTPSFATSRFILHRSAWQPTGNLRLVLHATSRRANNCKSRLGVLMTKKHLQMATCCEDSAGLVRSLTAPVRRGH